MQLRQYLVQCYDSLASRRDAEIEHLYADETYPGASGLVRGRLRFWDGSLFVFAELLEVRAGLLRKVEYGYHYQDADDNLIFRYDNSPHYPDLATFPHHKHVVEGGNELVEAATPPNLRQVLREIESFLYLET